MLSFNQFIQTAISSGIQNDSNETFFTIDGDQYTRLNTNILGRPESYPFESSEYLENHPELLEWLVFYTEYEDIQVRKYGVPIFKSLVRMYRSFYSTIVTGIDKELFEYYIQKESFKLSEYGHLDIITGNGHWKLEMKFRNGETRTETGEYKVI